MDPAASLPPFQIGANIAPHNMPLTSKKFIGAVEDEWQLFSDRASDYTLGQPIGFGASSIVYAAKYQPRPSASPTPCALKVLDLDTLPPRSLSLLQRETTLMSLSKHPNVLRVRGSWMDGHKLHIALRLMNKGSAADVMRYGWPGGMEEDVVRCILRQTLQGLNYLHINGFIHRDVKAANLLIDDDGTVLLGDLGVAADLTEDTSQVSKPSGTRSLSQDLLKQSNGTSGAPASTPKRVVLFDHTVPAPERPKIGKRKSFVGTPCWMAPELIQGRQYDSSADIWSFGITALELTQGRPPRSRETPQRVLLRTIQDDPPTLDREGGAYKYSRAFKDVVDSCLIKDPSKRPTAAELLQTPFFKAAKKKSYLVGAILQNLPPLTQRQERRATRHSQTLHTVDSWDFATTPNSATTSVYRRRISDIDDIIQGDTPQFTGAKPNGIFETEDETAPHDDVIEVTNCKGVSWAEETDALELNGIPNVDPLNSPSASDTNTSSVPVYIDSHLASSSVDGSSPPSSLGEPVPHSQGKAPKNLAPNGTTTGSKTVSSRYSASSSPNASLLSTSPNQQGLWHKIKSNVRRPSNRSDITTDGEKVRITAEISEKKVKSGMSGMSGLLANAGKHARSMTANQTT